MERTRDVAIRARRHLDQSKRLEKFNSNKDYVAITWADLDQLVEHILTVTAQAPTPAPTAGPGAEQWNAIADWAQEMAQTADMHIAKMKRVLDRMGKELPRAWRREAARFACKAPLKGDKDEG